MTNVENQNGTALAPEKEINSFKIKTTQYKTEEIETEITIPYYSKKGHNHYKVVSPDEYIGVWQCNSAQIVRWKKNNLSEPLGGETCSEEEFNSAHESALKIITESVNL